MRARSTQQVAFLDSEGRAYSTLVHTLPSARGNGEPLTGRFSPAAGAAFQALASGDNDARLVLASSHGYGFVTRFENLTSRNKAGKAMLNLTPNARVLPPAPVSGAGTDRIVAVTSAGHLLAFPVADLPELDKGKGNKIIDIPKAKLSTERVVAIAAVAPGNTLLVKSGQRTMSLSFKDLDAYPRRPRQPRRAAAAAAGRRSTIWRWSKRALSSGRRTARPAAPPLFRFVSLIHTDVGGASVRAACAAPCAVASARMRAATPASTGV